MQMDQESRINSLLHIRRNSFQLFKSNRRDVRRSKEIQSEKAGNEPGEVSSDCVAIAHNLSEILLSRARRCPDWRHNRT